MSDHHHEHEHVLVTKYGKVSSTETKIIQEQALKEGSTPVGYFLGKAASAKTQSERTFWLNKVDGARYMEERQKSRDKLDASAKRNMEADERLMETEASLSLKKVVGDACIVSLVMGKKEAPGGYSLIRRKSGEGGLTGYGKPRGNQWVVQGLQMDTIHEFAVVSADSETSKEVTGPWLGVLIGNISVDSVQEVEKPKKKSRMEQIVLAISTFTGRRTRDGRPYVRALRKHAKIFDITTRERNEGHLLYKSKGD